MPICKPKMHCGESIFKTLGSIQTSWQQILLSFKSMENARTISAPLPINPSDAQTYSTFQIGCIVKKRD